MPTRNISLPVTLDSFVEETIKSGRYDNASEVVRAGLRLLLQEEKENLAKLEALKIAIAEGLAGGAEDGEVVFARLEHLSK
jgi:antitoxin ParD1/3/4